MIIGGTLLERRAMAAVTCTGLGTVMSRSSTTLMARRHLIKGPFRHSACSLHASRTLTQSETVAEFRDSFIPYRNIPTVKGLPLIGSVGEARRWKSRTHLLAQRRFQELGSIFRERLGPIELVYLSDVAAFEKLYATEGTYPRRINVPSWTYWRDNSDFPDRGILTESDGPRWRSMRSVLEKRMLRPMHVMEQTTRLNAVVTDALTRLAHVQATHGGLQQLTSELFYWSLESMGSVMYETRFGGLTPEARDPDTWAFISSIREVFRTTIELIVVPPSWAKYVMPRTWRQHCQAWETIFSVGKKIIDARLKEVERLQEAGEEVHGFLAHMVAQQSLSLGQIYGNVTELMLAAVETTANVTQFAMYELARNPDIQEELRRQVANSCPNGEVPNYDNLKHIPMAGAIIKEVLRMYPPSNVSRLTPEDMVICDVRIPKGVVIILHAWSTGRDARNFEDPDDFRPGRWLGEDARRKHNPYASLPFSHGKKMCLGRRIAELNMKLFLSRMVQNYELRTDCYEPLKTKFCGVVIPDQPPNISLLVHKR